MIREIIKLPCEIEKERKYKEELQKKIAETRYQINPISPDSIRYVQDRLKALERQQSIHQQRYKIQQEIKKKEKESQTSQTSQSSSVFSSKSIYKSQPPQKFMFHHTKRQQQQQ